MRSTADVRPGSSGGGLLGLVAVAAGLWAMLVWRPTSEPLRLALDPWPSEELLWLAKERGLFAAEGLDVQVVEMQSAADSHIAFERGHVDLMVATCAELVGPNDRALRAVLALDASFGADVVLARNGIADVAALKGRRVAYEPGSLAAHHLLRALESAGLGWNDVTAVPMALVSSNEAFAKGEFDAVVTYPPWSVELVKAGGVHPIFDSSRIPNEIVDLVVTDATVLKRIPDLPARLRRVWGKAQLLLSDDAALAAMAARERMSASEFHAVLGDGIRLVPAGEQVD
ncbi:MAG: ABC transporter substrate-binding protein, partial [Planctomycetes bacterium]|nr:ABC transporter substrate-binding protein [Planctomycetota bacterium]